MSEPTKLIPEVSLPPEARDWMARMAPDPYDTAEEYMASVATMRLYSDGIYRSEDGAIGFEPTGAAS